MQGANRHKATKRWQKCYLPLCLQLQLLSLLLINAWTITRISISPAVNLDIGLPYHHFIPSDDNPRNETQIINISTPAASNKPQYSLMKFFNIIFLIVYIFDRQAETVIGQHYYTSASSAPTTILSGGSFNRPHCTFLKNDFFTFS